MPRRGVVLGCALVALVSVILARPAIADCSVPAITGQWQHTEDQSRWAFFSNNKVDCRLCREWNDNGSCVYVHDAGDEQKRRECRWTGGTVPGPQSRDGAVTVTGWRGENGRLSVLEFSDGTVVDMKGCKVDGKKGQVELPGLGTLACHYNYHCNKLARETK